MSEPSAEAPWLLLVHHLPAEPSRVRVKIWRRLQAVGAVAIKSSVYALPNTAETREDFEWIRGEIAAQGGEAMVFAAATVDELSSAEIRDALEAARQSDWQELEKRCEELAEGAAEVDDGWRDRLRRELESLRGRASRIDEIDYLGSPARPDAQAALARLERLVDPGRTASPGPEARRDTERYRGKVWLTRPRPGVDRMASAWLIRRFVDPEARFRFAERIPRDDDVVPFDMFGVELGHRGERVTFETLLDELGVGDPALTRIARIVHDLDLRVEPPRDVEADTVGRLVEGLRATLDDDQRLLDHGAALFEALYASYASRRPAS